MVNYITIDNKNYFRMVQWHKGPRSVIWFVKSARVGQGSSNSYTAELNNQISHPLEVVSRYRDPQLQVGEYYSFFF